MPKRSNNFQKLVFLLHQHSTPDAVITESRMLVDPTTGSRREVDICIEQTIGDYSILISIECRDHKRANDVTWIEQMKTKHERLPTNVLVLVSSSGFTDEALKVATRYNRVYHDLRINGPGLETKAEVVQANGNVHH